jgi:replicative DNA helicase
MSYRLNSVNKPVPRDLSEQLGKLPPQVLDLEQAVLGMAIQERHGQIVALEKLTPDDFYLETHKEIFQAICDLAKEGEGINVRTVTYQLKKTGKLELVGGAFFVMQLTQQVISADHIEHHCAIIIEKRLARDMIQFASEIQYKAYEDTNDVFELMNTITQFPMTALDKIKVGSERHIKDGVMTLAKQINARTQDSPEITGVPSGFTRLDRITQGWQATDFIVIAARPSMGKTTLVINLLRNAAVDFKIPVGFFSLEMSYIQLVNKFVSAETDIGLRTLTSKVFTPLDWTRFSNYTDKLTKAPIFIDDPSSLSIMDLRTKCRRLKEKYGVRLIVIDYLQLMKGDPSTKGNREQEIASISRGCKQIAKELGISVIALSQLSRSVEQRGGDKQPQLSDIRESGAIEQDADVVMFLYRPAYYKIMGDENGTYLPGLTKITLAKHRNGSLGEAALQMEGATSKFKSVDSPYLQTGAVQPTPTPAENKPLSDDDLPF